MKRLIAATAVATVVAAMLTASAAQAATSASCSLQPGSVLASGAQNNGGITVGWPPQNVGQPGPIFGVFKPGQVQLSTSFTSEAYSWGATNHGWVVQGDSLYYREYTIDIMNELLPDGPAENQPVGAGWSNYKAVEVSEYANRTTMYGLRADGTLFRWSADRWLFKKTGAAPGFAAVQSMALISKTSTYDTFLANTRGGALYTIRIPTTSPMKPIVKPVRTRTWQGFEKLVASKCGNYGTLLVGIDKDTRTAHWYAVGHANGTATVINHLSASGPSFNDPVYFRWGGNPGIDPLNGD
ncbi:hypothetical protein [Kribbella speibonae]|uniref:Uncharacterized protein n=1 Tax=Kribbella speibonae TaxID=1572660 RepID=A0ABY1ZYM4_9ACTN|nr:hypothetical protein [Kribbella speibonae]TCC18852.1 hypothetical protein E0H58_33880 [Kribbella speibonae]